MTKADARKRLLGFLINQLTQDESAPFGEDVACSQDSQEYRAFAAARDELVEEFNRRGAI